MEGENMNEVKGGLCPVTDDAFAQAYDAVDASLRARLKTNIALHYSMLGVPPSWQMHHTKRATDGFTMTQCSQPVSWVVIAVMESFASGPRLLAALMPCLLAGVEDVQVVRVIGTSGEGRADVDGAEGDVWPDSLLAALELAGQEQAASGNVDALVDAVQGKKTQGRVLLLGADGDGTGNGLGDGLGKTKSRIAHALAKMPHVTLWAEDHAPRLCVQNKEDFDVELIRWAHPDAVFCDAETNVREIMLDVVYTADEALSAESHAPLSLQKGCEALWMYPSLRPDFFMQDIVKIGLFE